MVEYGSQPACRRRRVALFASGWVPSLGVIRIGGRIISRQMAANAGSGRAFVDVIDVALGAQHRRMLARQRELRHRSVIERCPRPLCRRMARFAGSWESGSDVIGAGGGLVFRQVAADAGSRSPFKDVINVALGAQDGGVLAG